MKLKVPIDASGLGPEYSSTEVDHSPARTLSRVSTIPPEERAGLLDMAGVARVSHDSADFIITKESSWRPYVWNAEGYPAYGLPQRMTSVWPIGPNETFMEDPVAQLRWMDNYVKLSYGSWDNAADFWRANKYY